MSRWLPVPLCTRGWDGVISRKQGTMGVPAGHPHLCDKTKTSSPEAEQISGADFVQKSRVRCVQ